MATSISSRSATGRLATPDSALSRIGCAIVAMALIAAFGDAALADTPVSGMKAVTAGGNYTCAITASGGVQCWGANDVGQLGHEGGEIFQSTPVNVVDLSSGVTAFAAGDFHNCAATATGVDCWGSGAHGALGDGARVNRPTPVHVVGIGPGVKGIAAGAAHSCAITASGGVKCWGWNDFGQLGDGTINESLAPVAVNGLDSGVVAIEAGGVHTCALTVTGGVKCWGRTTVGQPIEPIPTDVPGLSSGVVSIAVGSDHACAVTAIGDARCWGLNKYGELGDGTIVPSPVPVSVIGMGAGVRAIAAGGLDEASHTCALTLAGGVKCWGSAFWGEVGDGTFSERHTPVDVVGLASGATAIATGAHHSCALTVGGRMRCWGINFNGAIGDNSRTLRLVPTASSLDERVTAIATGHWHTCAVTASGRAQCWGEGAYGQIGDGASIMRLVPTDVAGLASGVVGVSAGETSSCVSTVAGGAKCWGLNGFGQLGDGTLDLHPAPVGVVGLAPEVMAIAVGRWHACAILTGGEPKCWGGGGSGQLGIVPPMFRVPLPTSVVGLASGVGAITAGEEHTCAVVSGGVKCWGDNHYGQIGDGTLAQRNTPVDVIGLGAAATAVAAGFIHTCAITSGGGLRCWGFNGSGALGDGSTANRTMPVDVVGLGSGVVAVAAGFGHTCAIKAGGGVKCWGANNYGQLGDDSTTNRTTPVDVAGLGAGAIAIAAGYSHTCALTAAGNVLCWGQNDFGQIGNGEAATYPYPRDVVYASSASLQAQVPVLDSFGIGLLMLLLLGSGAMSLRSRSR